MIPDADRLLELERRSRRQGSGLQRSDLVGTWRLERIWPRGSRRPASFAASLLRGLAAQLQLAEAPGEGMAMVNSVRIGLLELRFEGGARLEGRRPLLVFAFDRLQLRWGDGVWFERTLEPPKALRRPFFALIAADRGSAGSDVPGAGWLAARGRGGGLALWRREGGAGTDTNLKETLAEN